jgi:L-threonylcarbamoyladenylate synthase
MAIIDTDLCRAKHFLEQRDVVAIPTETVYGLAANAYDEVAIAKIFAAKKRPLSNPLIVHIGHLDQIYELAHDIPTVALQLATHFWPGPLTLLLPKKNHISDLVTANSPLVAVRIPNHPTTLQLLRNIAFPVAAPSANLFGYISPTTPAHVDQQLGNSIPYILAGGQCAVGIESTIVGFEASDIIIYRLGSISAEAMATVLGPVKIKMPSPTQPLCTTPGSTLQHYAPHKPLFIGDIQTLLATHKDKKVGILSFDRYYNDVAKEHQVVLSPIGCLEEAAFHLFSALQKLDSMEIEVIVSAYVPDVGIGRAINDRLLRASCR